MEGRDFPVVIHRRREITPAEDCFVVIDENTGEVLRVIGGQCGEAKARGGIRNFTMGDRPETA